MFSHKVSNTFVIIFCIKKALISDCMNTGLYVTLYNHCVKPILLCGSEVWSIDFLINKRGNSSQRASNTFNHVVEAKRFEGVFLCRKVC